MTTRLRGHPVGVVERVGGIGEPWCQVGDVIGVPSASTSPPGNRPFRGAWDRRGEGRGGSDGSLSIMGRGEGLVLRQNTHVLISNCMLAERQARPILVPLSPSLPQIRSTSVLLSPLPSPVPLSPPPCSQPCPLPPSSPPPPSPLTSHSRCLQWVAQVAVQCAGGGVGAHHLLGAVAPRGRLRRQVQGGSERDHRD